MCWVRSGLSICKREQKLVRYAGGSRGPARGRMKGEAGRIVLKGRERPDFCLRNPCMDGGLGGRPSSLMNSLKRDVS